MVLPVPESQLQTWGSLLVDVSQPLAERFRALFGLRHAAEPLATRLICDALSSKHVGNSALLMHEIAYVLGQRGDLAAIPVLLARLEDSAEEVIVRHEAAEALAALSAEDARPVLLRFASAQDVSQVPVEVRQTCELAVARLDWLQSAQTPENTAALQESTSFNSVDPAPPEVASDFSTQQLMARLCDPSLDLFVRYRAMFALRSRCSGPASASDSAAVTAAVQALSSALTCPDSALLRHEVAFVLGQVAHAASFDALRERLADAREVGMVRHECAEALSALAEDGVGGAALSAAVDAVLRHYLEDVEPLVRESCEVALDMAAHLSDTAEFQYAKIPEAC